MLTKPQQQKRQRGFVLTLQGWSKLNSAIDQLIIQKDSKKQLIFEKQHNSIEELSRLSGLDTRTVARALAREEAVDKRSIESLFKVVNLKLARGDYSKPDCKIEELQSAIVNLHQDLREAVDVSSFHGRTEELAKLEEWVLSDCCRLVALLGMGGIGKTALAAKLVEQVKERFDYVIWRTLHNAPPVEDILADLIQFLSTERETTTALPLSFDSKVESLLECLRAHRCLLILDNAEAILLPSHRAGHYRAGYEGYSKLLKRVGEALHQSCCGISRMVSVAKLYRDIVIEFGQLPSVPTGKYLLVLAPTQQLNYGKFAQGNVVKLSGGTTTGFSRSPSVPMDKYLLVAATTEQYATGTHVQDKP